MHSFPLTITAVNKVYFSGDARSVTCPGTEGELTVLKGHEPLVSVLKEGEIIVRDEDSNEKSFNIKKGILEVHRGGVVVLV